MDVPQLVALRQRFPDARAKTFLLTCLAPDEPLEIADPVDGDDLAFQGMLRHISRAAEPIPRLLGSTQPSR